MATGIGRDMNLRRGKVNSENNVPKGVKDTNIDGIKAPRRPVLNDLSSNLQGNQNVNQKGKTLPLPTKKVPAITLTKPSTRTSTNLNRSTISTNLKIKPSLSTNKVAVRVNSGLTENASSIPKIITRPKTTGMRTLSLRSKSVGLTEIQKKEKEWISACKVDDIDKDDEYDPFLVGAYCKPIFEYLMTLENRYIIKPDYLVNHKFIVPSNRSVVVDWLVEVQQEFQIMQESLFLAVGIFDRYLQENTNVARNKLQLIGATSLLLGCKYEEIYVPEISDFVYLSDNAFTKDDVKSCLVDVFRTINYSLSRPFSLTFLRRISKASDARSSQHSLAKYFLELALIEYNLAHIKPSEIAVAGLLLAIIITNNPELDVIPTDINSLLCSYWSDRLEKHSHYKVNDLISTVQALANLALNAPEWKYKAVYKKYLTSKMGRIAACSLLSCPAMAYIAARTC